MEFLLKKEEEKSVSVVRKISWFKREHKIIFQTPWTDIFLALIINSL